MASSPKREIDQDDPEIAEIKRLVRECKRIRWRGLMNRMRTPKEQPHASGFLEDLVSWPRPGDLEVKLNASARTQAFTP